MGSEQSREAAQGLHPHTSAAGVSGVQRNSSNSPRPSICSDADLPYISYTVNRPIGESPKRSARGGVRGALRRSGVTRQAPRRGGRPNEVVVVREAPLNTQPDSDLARLQSITPFLPIVRSTLTAPTARDPEVLERVSPLPLAAIAHRYQGHLNVLAAVTASQQDDITLLLKQIDARAATLVSLLTERQRAYAKYAERLSQVTELSRALATCHANLNSLLDTLDTLNSTLPIPERLEAFVWTTG